MKLIATIGVLVLATLVTYWPVVNHDFIGIDDPVMVARNPDLNPPTAAGVAKYWQTSPRALYMPLTYTTWAAAAALPRDDDTRPARRFHVLSLLVHVLAVLAAFALLRELVQNNFAAAGGALLFSLHPLQVESVAWVSLLKDLLAGLFTIVAIWQYVRFVKLAAIGRAQRLARMHYALAMMAFLLGMLCKPSAVIAPLIAVAIDLGIFHRLLRNVAAALWPWFVLALPFVLVAQSVQRGYFEPIMGTPRELPLWWRPIVASDAITFYLGKLIWPAKLGVDYGRSPWHVMAQPWVWATAAIPVALAAVLWRFRTRLNEIVVATGIMVAALLPVLGLAPFDFQEKSTVTDHYMYLAMLGPAMALAWCLSRWPGRITYTIALLILIAFAVRSRVQTSHWRDSMSIYRHSIAINPQSWWLLDGLGWELLERGQPDEAVEQLHRAAEIAPEYAAVHAHLGAAYAETARVPQAVAHLEKSLRIDPEQPRTHVLLGDIQMLRGMLAEAIEHYKAAAAHAPDDPVVIERLNRVRLME